MITKILDKITAFFVQDDSDDDYALLQMKREEFIKDLDALYIIIDEINDGTGIYATMSYEARRHQLEIYEDQVERKYVALNKINAMMRSPVFKKFHTT